MIAVQSSGSTFALRAVSGIFAGYIRLASPAAWRKLAGDNIPGLQASMTSHPGGAPERAFKSVYIRAHPWLNIFSKVGFSGFSLGNREKIAFATTSNSSHFSAKIPGCLTHKHRL
jgi:hypothetical protein